jgi:hypothetical protein
MATTASSDTETTKQEDDKNKKEDGAKRHGLAPVPVAQER